jgi:nonsense-mediated mRNA decay protein 3
MIICPKCGRSNEAVKFIEAFCIDCYPYKFKLPEDLELQVCKRCERMLFKGEWMPYNSKKIEEYVVSKCKGDFSSAKYDIDNGVVIFTIKKGDAQIDIERFVELKKMVTICPRCSRISGGYYEAIIQLRGNDAKIAKYNRILTEMLKKSTFISKSEEKDEGTDIYVGSSKAVVGVITELGLRTKITRKLAGLKDGKRFHRVTFLLRFD